MVLLCFLLAFTAYGVLVYSSYLSSMFAPEIGRYLQLVMVFISIIAVLLSSYMIWNQSLRRKIYSAFVMTPLIAAITIWFLIGGFYYEGDKILSKISVKVEGRNVDIYSIYQQGIPDNRQYVCFRFLFLQNCKSIDSWETQQPKDVDLLRYVEMIAEEIEVNKT